MPHAFNYRSPEAQGTLHQITRRQRFTALRYVVIALSTVYYTHALVDSR